MKRLLAVAYVSVLVSAAEAAPAVICEPTRFGACFYPEEAPSVKYVLAHKDRVVTNLVCTVTDWLGREVYRRAVPPAGITAGTVAFSAADLGGRYGVFKAAFEGTGTNGTVSCETWFLRLTGANPKPCRWIGTGMHGHHGWRAGDLRPLDILSAAGIGTVRGEVGWRNCETKKGRYVVPPAFENFVDGLVAHGISLNFLLSYDNPVAYPENPIDSDAFARWAGWMAGHFKGRVDVFEIWNEPQNFGFRKYIPVPSPDKDPGHAPWVARFVSHTRKAAAAIRAAQPDATVAVTGEDLWVFLKSMIEQGIAGPDDCIAFHPYCHRQPRPEREYFFNDGGKALKELVAKHGGAKRFRITECGWTTTSPTGNVECAFVGNYPRSTYVSQAQYIVRAAVLARQYGVESFIQYDFRDDGADRHYTEHNFGLVHCNRDYTPKPALGAIAFLTRLLGDAEPCGDLSDDPARYHLCRFARTDGRMVVVAWSVEGDIDVPLPKSLPAVLSVTDLQGNAVAKEIPDRCIRLSELPVYLERGRIRESRNCH